MAESHRPRLPGVEIAPRSEGGQRAPGLFAAPSAFKPRACHASGRVMQARRPQTVASILVMLVLAVAVARTGSTPGEIAGLMLVVLASGFALSIWIAGRPRRHGPRGG